MPSLYPPTSDPTVGVKDIQKDNVHPSQIMDSDSSQKFVFAAANKDSNTDDEIGAISGDGTSEDASKGLKNFDK